VCFSRVTKLVGGVKTRKINVEVFSRVNLLDARTARFSKVSLLGVGIVRSSKVNLLGTSIVRFKESKLLISIFEALG